MRFPVLKQTREGVTLNPFLLVLIYCQFAQATTFVLEEMTIIGLFLFILSP